ncbi:unnamed protein product, partial [Cyprideis torosa]
MVARKRKVTCSECHGKYPPRNHTRRTCPLNRGEGPTGTMVTEGAVVGDEGSVGNVVQMDNTAIPEERYGGEPSAKKSKGDETACVDVMEHSSPLREPFPLDSDDSVDGVDVERAPDVPSMAEEPVARETGMVGDCLFEAVRLCLSEVGGFGPVTVRYLRTIVAEQLLSNDFFRTTYEPQGQGARNFDDFVRRIRDGFEYGTGVCISALCLALKIRVGVATFARQPHVVGEEGPLIMVALST